VTIVYLMFHVKCCCLKYYVLKICVRFKKIFKCLISVIKLEVNSSLVNMHMQSNIFKKHSTCMTPCPYKSIYQNQYTMINSRDSSGIDNICCS